MRDPEQHPVAVADKKNTHDEEQSWKYLFAGGVAGGVSRTAVSPLERLKILYQLQQNGPRKYKSIPNALVTIWREEGLRGYLKGNGTNVIRIVPYSAVQFASYEYFKNLLGVTTDKELQPFLRFVGGALAGIASVTATYPLDLIRTRLSAAVGDTPPYRGILHAFVVIVRDEGVLALFKGISATVMGIAPYVGLNFMVYETTKRFIMNIENKKDLPVTVRLACGGFAGAVAQTVTYPLDVLRRVMQMQGAGSNFPVYRNTWQCAKSLYKSEGILAFYKGLIPNFLKVVPSISIQFVVYEAVKKRIAGW